MRNLPNGSGGLYNVDGNRWGASALDDRQTGDLGGAQAPQSSPEKDKVVFSPGQHKDRMKIPAGLAPTEQERKNDETISQEWNGYIFVIPFFLVWFL